MYNYIALRADISPCDEDKTDLLAAFLADAEFETFEPDKTGLTAYVRKDKYKKNIIEEIIKEFPIECDIKISEKEIEGKDWNEEWEKNYFKPIIIDGRLVVRSSFHEAFPDMDLEIVVDPKMAFGTGHHATTAGMAKLLLETEVKGKKIIDMGTGTGILAILAKKLGGGDTVGIDIDEFAIENARENGKLNNVDITWITGDDKALVDLSPADIFLANINLNVITENLEKYLAKLKPGGEIFLSGFLESDRGKIIETVQKMGLTPVMEKGANGWIAMKLSN